MYKPEQVVELIQDKQIPGLGKPGDRFIVEEYYPASSTLRFAGTVGEYPSEYFIPVELEQSKEFTTESLLELHDTLSSKARSIMAQKNHDYTSGGGVFDNFKNSEILGIPGELGLLLRVIDKIKRLQTFITKGTLQVQDEGFEDACLDVINYMVLLNGMLKEK